MCYMGSVPNDVTPMSLSESEASRPPLTAVPPAAAPAENLTPAQVLREGRRYEDGQTAQDPIPLDVIEKYGLHHNAIHEYVFVP